jgi:hypothetical protein
LLLSGAILSSGDFAAECGGEGKIMLRTSLKWIPVAVASMVVATPLAAQQAMADGQPTPQQQPTPDLAPPVPQTSTELPPPFPHYPARKPREHDPNYRAGKHRVSHAQSSHRSKPAPHQAKASHRGAATHAKANHRAATHHPATHQYFSKRTIRQCHGMTYKQIMAHRNCRTMMQQELAAKPSHHAKSHKAARKTTHRHHRR